MRTYLEVSDTANSSFSLNRKGGVHPSEENGTHRCRMGDTRLGTGEPRGEMGDACPGQMGQRSSGVVPGVFCCTHGM